MKRAGPFERARRTVDAFYGPNRGPVSVRVVCGGRGGSCHAVLARVHRSMYGPLLVTFTRRSDGGYRAGLAVAPKMMFNTGKGDDGEPELHLLVEPLPAVRLRCRRHPGPVEVDVGALVESYHDAGREHRIADFVIALH